MTALQPALSTLSAKKVQYYEIPAHTQDLSDALNEVLSKTWKEKRGIEVFSFNINSLSIPEDQRKKINEWEENAMTTNPTTAAARLVGGQVDAMKTALEIRIPDRTFRLLSYRICTSSFQQALSSAPASSLRTPDRIFRSRLFRRNRSRYPPAAVPVPTVMLQAVVLPVAAAVPWQTGSGHSCRPFRQHSSPYPFP